MEKILSFQKFNESINAEIAQFHFSIVEKITDGEIPDLLNNEWTYDAFSSLQADSKLPASYCQNGEYTCAIMHDDYDNTGWGIVIFKTDEDEEPVVRIVNLEIEEAWKEYAAIVGVQNAKVTVKENPNQLTTIEDWLEKNPIYASKKLKNLTRTGVFESNINDQVLMDFRASMDMRKKWEKEDAEREEKRKAQHEESKIALRRKNSLILINWKIKEKEQERNQIQSEMENDPSVEVEGGEVADQYGDQLNKIDKEISRLYKKKELIKNPVLKSKVLSDLNDKTGIFKQDVE